MIPIQPTVIHHRYQLAVAPAAQPEVGGDSGRRVVRPGNLGVIILCGCRLNLLALHPGASVTGALSSGQLPADACLEDAYRRGLDNDSCPSQARRSVS